MTDAPPCLACERHPALCVEHAEPIRLEAEQNALGVPLTLEQMKALHVSRVLAETDWNIAKAARLLAVHSRTVHRMIHDYDLVRPAKARGVSK